MLLFSCAPRYSVLIAAFLTTFGGEIVRAQQVATWEETRTGVLTGDFAAGYSSSDLQATNQGIGKIGSANAGFAWIGVQAPMLSLLMLTDFFADKRWRIEDYERLGTGLGAGGRGGVWFGAEYGAGLQGVFRISDLVDVGARYYWAFFNDNNMARIDKGSSSGIYYVGGRARAGSVYLDYTRGLASGDKDHLLSLNVLEAKYLFNAKDGRALGVRVDFAAGNNTLSPPSDIDATNYAVRLSYIYALY